HPALVHLPTGLLPAGFIFDILSRCGVGGNAMVQVSFYSIALGLVVAVLAAPAGLADWLDIKPQRPAYKMGLWHMGVNVAVLALFTISFALRWNGFTWQMRVGMLPVLLSAAGTAVLIVSGYLGSRMVFDQGIGVARLSKGK